MKILGLAAAGLLLVSQAHAQVTAKYFQASTVGDLRSLCSASDFGDQGRYAVGFCYGWIVGVGQFYEQLLIDERFGLTPTACTDKDVTREEALKAFLDWARAHPDASGRPALSGFIDAMKEAYPCK